MGIFVQHIAPESEKKKIQTLFFLLTQVAHFPE